MSKYVIIYNYDTCDAKCSNCDFAGKKYAEFDNIDELQKEWCKAIYDGQDIDIYKKMEFKIQEL